MALLGSTPILPDDGASSVADIWYGDGSVWAASADPGGGVYRVNPTTGHVEAHNALDALQIAFSPHQVWLSASAGPSGVNPLTARPIAALPPSKVMSGGSAGIALVDGQLWVTYGDIQQLQRIRAG